MLLIAFIVTIVVGVLKLLGVALVASVTWPLWWTVLGCIVGAWIIFYLVLFGGVIFGAVKALGR